MGVRFVDIDGQDREIIAEAVVEHLSEDTESEELQASMLDTLEID
jgi:hypothetical protein